MKVFLAIIISIIFILMILELGMLFLLRFPGVLRRLSRKLQNSIGHLYVFGERKIIQFQKGFGRYHEDFGYTLMPGKFTFSQREYSNDYFINSLGVRSSEEALESPDIIILGNSYTMGWGVDQDKTFAGLLEKKTNLKILNAAVPAFGTVREMLMLRRIDRSRMRCLILQYCCSNDFEENLKYYINGNRPQIMHEDTFRSLVSIHSKPQKYFFGKNLFLKIKKRIDESKNKKIQSNIKIEISDIDLFLQIFKQNEDILDVPIIFFEINGRNQINVFSNSLKQKITEASSPCLQKMIVLDMSKYLTDNNFYMLDDHLNNSGHAIVADVLYKKIKEMKLI